MSKKSLQSHTMVKTQETEAKRKMSITQPILDQIRATIGTVPAEQGGILGGDIEDGVVRAFHFDHTANRTRGTYSPDHDSLNKLLREEWNPKGIRLLGFVHSHPPGVSQPSGGDLIYAQKLLGKLTEIDHLLLPIVQSQADAGKFAMLPFAATRGEQHAQTVSMELEILDDKEAVCSEEEAPATPDLRETFARVANAYDLERLSHCRLIIIGTGGAAEFIEDMARTGIGEFVLVDPDLVAVTNIATQQVYRRDLDRPKVECLAERILDINPGAVVIRRQQWLNDISDDEFEELAFAKREGEVPEMTLLLGLTDNFEAQARINRLALKCELPSLCAQVYREGRAAEISFTHPDTTPACHRCALRGRYVAYLEQGFQNDVTSQGTPICATTRLNALKEFLTLAILHHGTDHPRWGDLLKRIGNRNLIQIRMDPDLADTLGLKVFERVFSGGDQERILFDETVWLPQKPDCPENGFPTCPDCGGSGDLRKSVQKAADTRIMRK